MKVLLVDAFDSFVFIIEQYLKSLGLETVVKRCNDPELLHDIRQAEIDFVVLGPGPGNPADAGYVKLIEELQVRRLPVLGICLGHQAIGLAFGGDVVCADKVMHGKTSIVENDGRGAFAHTGGQPNVVTRYHSLIIRDGSLPKSLDVTARSTDDGYIMGVRHRDLPIEGVQFHPESVMTDNGYEFFQSFISCYVAPLRYEPRYRQGGAV